MNGSVEIAPLVEKKNTDVEVGFKVFLINFESFLVVDQNIIKVILLATLNADLLDTSGHGVQSIDIFRVNLQNLIINFFLYLLKTVTYRLRVLLLIYHQIVRFFEHSLKFVLNIIHGLRTGCQNLLLASITC